MLKPMKLKEICELVSGVEKSFFLGQFAECRPARRHRYLG